MAKRRVKQTKGLVLVPSIKDLTREEYEGFIEGAQARRLAAAVVYFETKATKLGKVSEHFQLRIEKQREMLGKQIARIEYDLEKMQQRVDAIHQLEQEAGLVGDQLDELKKLAD